MRLKDVLVEKKMDDNCLIITDSTRKKKWVICGLSSY